MATTIQVSNNLVNRLRTMKMTDSESYENVIWDLIEDRMELSTETRKNIAKAEKEFREGKTISLEEIERKMKMRKCTK